VAFIDYYELMHLHPRADQALIEYAFRHLVKDLHPDRGGDTALMARLNVAHDVLANPAARQGYDREWQQYHARRTNPLMRGGEVQATASSLLVVEPTLLLVDSMTLPSTGELAFAVWSEAGQFSAGVTVLTPSESAHPRYRPDHWLSLARITFVDERSGRSARVYLHVDVAKLPKPRPARGAVYVISGRQRVVVHVVVLTSIVSFCPACHQLGSPKHRFCRKCGGRLRCSACDAPFEQDRTFCGHCGTPRQPTAAEAAEPLAK
jgi:hypothetical protein